MDTGRFEPSDFPHSALSKALRFRFREYRDLRTIYMANMASASALSGHPKVDFGAACKLQTEMLNDVLSKLPYFRGKTRQVEHERERAVELFNEVAVAMEQFSELLFKPGSGKVDIESE